MSTGPEGSQPPKGGIRVFQDVQEFQEAFRRRSDRLSPRDYERLSPDATHEQPEARHSVRPSSGTGVRLLQELCQARLERYITLSTVLTLLHYTAENGHLFTPSSQLREKCEKFVASTFGPVCEAEGADAVRAAMPDRFDAMEAEDKEWQQKQQRRAHMGRVLEKETPESRQVGEASSTRSDVQCYPLESLKAGMAWPSNVDPARREMFLSDEDYQKAFGMGRKEFVRLPMWKSRRLKQDAGLF